MTATNIGPAEQRKRLNFGIASFIGGCAWAAAGGAKSVSGVVVLFALFLFAALGVLQARRGTCLLLAARGMRRIDAAPEMITDGRLKSELRSAARTIQLASLLAAVVITLAVYWAVL